MMQLLRMSYIIEDAQFAQIEFVILQVWLL